MFPNIHGKPDGKNQEERKMRKKVKQANSQNLGKTKLASCKLFTAAKTLDCQQHYPPFEMPFTSSFIIFSSSS
jgi:hypothetical protein